ncbi:MAG: hypothetical protein MJK04_35175 [Psychrosphaera sp.]|nr:hypothetical protein [Psychrosphaera sp.]
MNFKQTKIVLMLTLAAMAPSSFAASKSVKHSVGITGSVSKAAVSVVAASVAVPFFIVGTAVQGSVNASDRFDKPLPIADETIIAGPSPKDALATKTQTKAKDQSK